MLGRLFSDKPKVIKIQTVAALSSGLRTSILNLVGANSITAMPSSAQRAFQLATNPDAEARDFVELIGSDEALSARIIKIANSVFFDRGSRSESIEECVNKIGINELRSLLTANTLADILPSRHGARSQLWANDLGTAISAKILCERILPAKAPSAFLGGLMHDVGKLLLLQRRPDEYSQIMLLVQQKTHDFSLAEQELFAFDHTQVGQLIAEKWMFTPDITEIIRSHHQAAPSKTSLPYLVQCANSISHSLGLGHGKGFGALRNAHADKLPAMFEALEIQSGDANDLLKQCQLCFESDSELYQGRSI